MTRICLKCGGEAYLDNESGRMRCASCCDDTPDSPGSGDTARRLGAEALQSGRVEKAEQYFLGLIERDPADWKGWFLMAWTRFALSGGVGPEPPASGLDALRRARRQAPGQEAFAQYAESFLTRYLDMVARRYSHAAAMSTMEEITDPLRVNMLCLFQLAWVLAEQFGWEPTEAYTNRLDNWISCLTMRLFRQAEFSVIRLRLPVELITKQDVRNAKVLFAWMDALEDVIILISARCGEAFYELKTAFMVDIADKCLPQLVNACTTYSFTYPFEQDAAATAADVAQEYAYMVLDTGYSVAGFDKRIKMGFVESVPLLLELKVVWDKPDKWLQSGERIAVEPETIYSVPESEYWSFVKRAAKLARELREEDSQYLPPAYLQNAEYIREK